MRFSKNLLDDNEIRDRLFQSSVQKTNNFIREIFQVDVESDANLIKGNKIIDRNNYKYGLVIAKDGRSIGIGCCLEEVENDMYAEVINIFEVLIDNLPLPDQEDMSYNEMCDYAQTYLEDKYDLNFTPIDPENNDANILSIEEDPDKFLWKALFVQPYHDGQHLAQINIVDGTLILETVTNSRQKIYLD